MTDTTIADESREMRLFSLIIRRARRTHYASLAELLAYHRAPGGNWARWPEIGKTLESITGERVSDVALRRWAKIYGIPESTTADGMRGLSDEDYAEALRTAGITI